MTGSDYDHRRHVGNGGDVWKHVAWLALLAGAKRERIVVLDTHAGAGRYTLPTEGEWTTGVGRLRGPGAPESTGSGAVDRYLAKLAKLPRGTYPGSPLLALGALGRNDRLVAYEADPGACAALREAVRDPKVKVVGGDGWQAPELGAPGTGGSERSLVHVDPPYSDKEDWVRAVDAVRTAAEAGHQVMLWYPIKRWSRPNLLLQRVREAGVPYVALDLLWTPMELEKKRMVGAGVLLVGAPRSVVIELHGAAPVVGAALATDDGRWSLRVTANRDAAG